MQTIGVETTQHVTLNYTPAPILDRVLAFFLDTLILVGYFLILRFVFGLLIKTSTFTVIENQWIALILTSIVPLFYHLVSEVLWNGKSFGKWMMYLQVVRTDGTNATFGNYLIRWIFRLLEITFTGGTLALITVLINGKGQRLGDLATKTCVIKTRRKVTLNDTIYSEISSDYIVKYPSTTNLTDNDISIIKQLLKSKKNYENATWFVMVQRTANIIQNKISVIKEEPSADDFLIQIIKDYNYLHQ